MIYLQLFLSFLQVGMFSSGGYAAIPLIRDQIVTSHTWLTMNEFTDLITIAEMTPGPIAVNSATFVGIRLPALWVPSSPHWVVLRLRFSLFLCWLIFIIDIRMSLPCKAF